MSAPKKIQSAENFYYCYNDASWVDEEQKVGIGWLLPKSDHRMILQGSSSIEATSTVLETETLALNEAVIQINRLKYKRVNLLWR